jgi:uncharacterized membrane protein YgcG
VSGAVSNFLGSVSDVAVIHKQKNGKAKTEDCGVFGVEVFCFVVARITWSPSSLFYSFIERFKRNSIKGTRNKMLGRRSSMLSVLLWALVVAVAATASGGKSYSPADLKSPMLGPKEAAFCGRPGVERSAICDPDNLMTKESKDVIEGTINKIKNAEVAVVVINSMSSYFQMFRSVDTSAEKFARAVHDSWGVGDRNTNNGVLVFLSISDRAWYVSTGEGVQDRLYGETIDQVMDHAKGKLRSNDVGGAVEGVINEMEIILSKPPQKKSTVARMFTNVQGMAERNSWTLYLAVIAVVCIASIFGENKQSEMVKGKNALDKLLTEVRDLRINNKFQSNSCPICLEDFVDSDESTKKMDVESLAESEHANGQQKEHKRSIVALHCGHIFCRECIVNHMSGPGGDKCPICREGIDAKLGTAFKQSSWSGLCSRVRHGCRPSPYQSFSHHSHHHPELLFRLHRMRYMYPHAMTAESHTALTNAVTSNSLEQFVTTGESRSVAINTELIELRQASARSGSAGSSRSSFGGGRSFGGRGGRW